MNVGYITDQNINIGYTFVYYSLIYFLQDGSFQLYTYVFILRHETNNTFRAISVSI
jgi:hypothetical protein